MFSILLLMMVVVGGAGTIWGALLGAAVLTLLPEYLRGLEDFEVLARVKGSGARPADLIPALVPRLIQDAASTFDWELAP